MLRFSLHPATATLDIAGFDPIDRKHVASTAGALKDGFNHCLEETPRPKHWPDLYQLILPDPLSYLPRNDPWNILWTTAFRELAKAKLLELNDAISTACALSDTLECRPAKSPRSESRTNLSEDSALQSNVAQLSRNPCEPSSDVKQIIKHK